MTGDNPFEDLGSESLDPLGDDLLEDQPRDDEPYRLAGEVAAQLRPLFRGVGAILFVGLLTGGWLVFALSSQNNQITALAVEASKLDNEQEWALREFAPKEAPGFDVKLGSFVVSPLGPAKIRYIRCTVVLTVADMQAFEATGLAQTRARAAIHDLLSTQTIEELGAPGGLEVARGLLRRRILDLFPDGLLLGVHFPEFIVQ